MGMAVPCLLGRLRSNVTDLQQRLEADEPSARRGLFARVGHRQVPPRWRRMQLRTGQLGSWASASPLWGWRKARSILYRDSTAKSDGVDFPTLGVPNWAGGAPPNPHLPPYTIHALGEPMFRFGALVLAIAPFSAP